VAIDDATWSGLSTPAARWTPGRRFFKPDADPGDVLVAEVAGVVAGYVKLGTPSPLASRWRPPSNVGGSDVICSPRQSRLRRSGVPGG
jgi:hypothetical protein